MSWKLILIGITILLCLGVGLPWGHPAEKPLELTILHTNDVHAHYAPFPAAGTGPCSHTAIFLPARISLAMYTRDA